MGLKVNDKVPLFAVVSRLTNQKVWIWCWRRYRGCWSRAASWRYLARAIRCFRRVPRGGGGTPVAGWRTDRLSRSFLASHYGRRGRYSGAQSFRTVRLNAVIWLKVWHAASGAAYRGLADTVSDSSLENLADGIASGFVFEDSNARSLLRAIRRAFVLWSRPSLWRFVQRQAMAMDFSWQVAAKSYRELYYRLK